MFFALKKYLLYFFDKFTIISTDDKVSLKDEFNELIFRMSKVGFYGGE